ncbi:MAG: serine carboxypeptidase, partial [Anaerolineae bacterium]
MAPLSIACLHFHSLEPHTETVTLLGQSLTIEYRGCDKNLELMAAHIAELDGKVAAIALQDVARTLKLGRETVLHAGAGALLNIAQKTPVVDGSGVRAALERWAVRLAAEAQPGIWSRKRTLITPGLRHNGLAQALSQYTPELRYADPIIYFALPNALGVGRANALATLAGPILSQLRDAPFNRLFPTPGEPGTRRSPKAFAWADILAGDMGAIRRYAPPDLRRKIIVAEAASGDDIANLTERGATAVVTTMPPLANSLSKHSAAVFEACLAALRPNPASPLTENTYLNLIADLDWRPGIQFLQPEEAGINRFAFVIHPLSVKFIHKHPAFRWTRILPDRLVEWAAANLPPFFVSRITNIQSPTTGQKVEGYLITLGGTPRELMRRDPAFVYRRLIRAARMAERLGARLMGLGAFTSVVGDAGITVAQKADIAITSGNSLTVAATLETAKQAAVKMGNSLDRAHEGQAMV